jgi:hypothetical protein
MRFGANSGSADFRFGHQLGLRMLDLKGVLRRWDGGGKPRHFEGREPIEQFSSGSCRPGCSGPRRLMSCRRANDVRLNHHIGPTTDEEKMLDIVATDEYYTSASIDRDGINYSHPPRPTFVGVTATQPSEHSVCPLVDWVGNRITRVHKHRQEFPLPPSQGRRDQNPAHAGAF